MKKKNLLNLSIYLFFFFIIVLSSFLYIENLNFLFKKNSFISNTILPNSAVGDAFNFYHNNEADINFKIYLNDFFFNLKIGKFYPGNNLNFKIFIKLFDQNSHLFYAFNLFFYFYFTYKFSNFFKKKKLIIYLILSCLNILILGSLSLPNKDILCYFSFNALLLYYLKSEYKFLFISFFFAAISRHELIILNILVLILNNNFFLQINNFLIKKSKILFIIFIYIFYNFILFLFIKFTIDIFIKYFFFYLLKIIFFFILFRIFLKKIDNYLFCRISYLALFIIFISVLIPKYYWFTVSNSLLSSSANSLGLSFLIYEICLKGFFFIVYPFKIAITLFGNVFQKINFSSYETILSFWSQLLFFFYFFLLLLKNTLSKIWIFYL